MRSADQDGGDERSPDVTDPSAGADDAHPVDATADDGPKTERADRADGRSRADDWPGGAAAATLTPIMSVRAKKRAGRTRPQTARESARVESARVETARDETGREDAVRVEAAREQDVREEPPGEAVPREDAAVAAAVAASAEAPEPGYVDVFGLDEPRPSATGRMRNEFGTIPSTLVDRPGAVQVRRSEPASAMTRWIAVAAVAAIFVLASFLMIPQIFSSDDDPEPAAASSAPPVVTAEPTAAAPPPPTYNELVATAGPAHYWRYEPADPELDETGASPLKLGKRTGHIGLSAISGGSGSIDCPGLSTSSVYAQSEVTVASELTVEVWINTASVQGGQVVSFGSKATGQSPSSRVDYTIYVDPGGAVSFGAYSDYTRYAVHSKKSVSDGQWHHVVGTMSATEGIKIYVDGELIDHEPEATEPTERTGFWRICGDNSAGWPRGPSTPYFTGSVDETAIYHRPLSAEEIAAQFAAR